MKYVNTYTDLASRFVVAVQRQLSPELICESQDKNLNFSANLSCQPERENFFDHLYAQACDNIIYGDKIIHDPLRLFDVVRRISIQQLSRTTYMEPTARSNLAGRFRPAQPEKNLTCVTTALFYR